MKKLSLSLIVITLISIVMLGWAIDKLFEQLAVDQQQDIIGHYQTIGQQLASTIDISNDAELFITTWNQLDKNQLSLTAQGAFPLPDELISDFKDGKPLVLRSEQNLSFHYWLPKQNSILTFTPQELINLIDNESTNLALTVLFYLGIVLVIALWLTPLIRRLQLLRRSAMAFGDGQFQRRIKLSKSSFIADIEAEFNRMADKIESLIADNKLISSAVSHDLKTPLARLRLGIDVLEDCQDETTRTKYIERLNSDIDEMQSLIEVLIGYARLEQALIKLDKSPIDLVEVVTHLQQHYQQQGFDFKIEIALSKKSMMIAGDRHYLRMLLQNILQNSFNYFQQAIKVKISDSTDQITLDIHDDGPGIPESIRDDVVKPFIKSESSGHGLGLAIAERIAEWHKAKLTIADSKELGGAQIQIAFKKVV